MVKALGPKLTQKAEKRVHISTLLKVKFRTCGEYRPHTVRRKDLHIIEFFCNTLKNLRVRPVSVDLTVQDICDLFSVESGRRALLALFVGVDVGRGFPDH